ncbi:hypothetical protein F0L74_04245 [Chitinophaga agrisoli]|uniref:Uncharacterized protein n=1 Tax=Chitinophaga agrisoli TaxID=2607653 RepID=A0A5B2W2T7_9BACT|nr:hypothetical protein [Chitinophaga agrisoli]KAA2245178.1 hypothetical protein F0L74_04245 [Chitinophaga agrisoli]
MSVDINISNYEEYLLSYIDGELSPEECTALEAFLQQHPQQARELEVYKAAILQPDRNEVFDRKDTLYHSATITLENYETFLLSYIDGELNETERTALEAFLKKHPHVEQELEIWQSTRLQAGDTPVFEQKEMLYRHTDSITPENYETYLLSYIDGELSPAEETAVQAFLGQHPELKGALELLERTRLTPDPALRMPGKSQLYWHSRTTIRPVWWWGAAAAVLAGCLFWLLPLQQHGPGSQPTAVAPAPMAANNAPVPATQPPATAPDAKEDPIKAPQQVEQPLPQEKQGPLLAANSPAARPQAESKDVASRASKVPDQVAANRPATVNRAVVAANNPVANNTVNNNNNNTPPLTQLPQPRATSADVVQQHLEKKVQPEVMPVQETVNAGNDQVLASTASLPRTPEPEKIIATPAPAVQGELIMSVSSSSESKLLNGVTNVAKFFSRKKHQK